MKEGKFGPAEAVCLVTITIISKVFFSSPSTFVRLVGNSIWYTTFISVAVASVGFYFVCRLLKRFPGDDLTEIYEKSMGRWVGFTLSLIVALFMLILTEIRISETTEFLKVYVMPSSPNWLVNGIFAACILTLGMLGLESMARFSKGVIYSLILGLSLVLLLSIQNYNVNNLFPIMGYGMDKVVLHGLSRPAVYSEVIILAIFAKSFQGHKYIKREGYISLGISALVISVCSLAFVLTYPYYTAQEITAPIYEMTMLIDYGRFMQRVEALFLYVWIISSFLSATVIFYSFVYIYCKIFRIEDKRQVIFGGTVIIYTLSMMHGSIINIINSYTWFVRYLGGIPLFVFPLIVLICACIRKKGVRGNA